MRPFWQIACAICLLAASVTSNAEVTAAADSGFISEHNLLIAASPGATFVALTDHIGQWWDAAHSYSGQAENFYLEARANGCFCEKLDSGGSVMHMQVSFSQPGKVLRLLGGLGPLQEMGVSGAMSFVLEPSLGGTLLHYRYAVHGFVPGGLAGLAEVVDEVQLGQLLRLKDYLEP